MTAIVTIVTITSRSPDRRIPLGTLSQSPVDSARLLTVTTTAKESSYG